MPDLVPEGCYEAKQGRLPPWPEDALPLWNDDVDSDQAMRHVMSKAAKRYVLPEAVAEFSSIPGAVARIEKRHAGDYWVIRRPEK